MYRALLLLGVALAVSSAQAQNLTPVLDLTPSVEAVGGNTAVALVDSIYYDTGDDDYQFTIGFGFPGGSATPIPPGPGIRATSYTPAVKFTVPPGGPFVLTGMRARYRTSSVSGATSTPPRVQYDADAPPTVTIFRGADFPPAPDSTGGNTGVYEAELPYTTAVLVSTVDNYPVPVPEWVQVNFAGPGGTVSNDLVFQPGDVFYIQIQFYNVPFPMQTEAGVDNSTDGTSFSFNVNTQVFGTLDLLTSNGPFFADTGGADGIQDLWVLRALSDDAFFPTSSEEGAPSRAIALGRPSPNPASAVTHVPFALTQAGHARLAIHDVTGREVLLVTDAAYAAGGQVAAFDASALPAGVYVVVLEAAGERQVQKLSVVR